MIRNIVSLKYSKEQKTYNNIDYNQDVPPVRPCLFHLFFLLQAMNFHHPTAIGFMEYVLINVLSELSSSLTGIETLILISPKVRTPNKK